jgi:hypothetical protein
MFRDAVNIAREFDIPCVWIDSLCIIQDDTGNWEAEASHMGEVHANSYLTVATLSLKDDSSGCFPDFSTRYNEWFVSANVRSTGRRCFFHAAPILRWEDSQSYPTFLRRYTWATNEVTNGRTEIC